MSNPLVDVIGVAGSTLTLIGFLQANFPAKPPEGATVNIKAGLPALDSEDASLGGSISKIYAFDNRNGYAGQADGCHIGSGGICTKTVAQSVAGRRARYISVSNNDDATCIAWISVNQFDDTSGGAWTGDIGYQCGHNWYNSVESAGKLKDDQGGGEYIPKCTWIDANHSNDLDDAALKFDVTAYGENAADTAKSDACAPTIYGPENGPIAKQPGKRSVADRPAWMTERLIMSNFTSQPAEELCNSTTSWGPDFIGPDGKFCDMTTKTLSPLCSSNGIDGCVEVNEQEGTLVKRMSVARRSADIVHKSYTKVSKWGQ